jgi:hypothetical protein
MEDAMSMRGSRLSKPLNARRMVVVFSSAFWLAAILYALS